MNWEDKENQSQASNLLLSGKPPSKPKWKRPESLDYSSQSSQFFGQQKDSKNNVSLGDSTICFDSEDLQLESGLIKAFDKHMKEKKELERVKNITSQLLSQGFRSVLAFDEDLFTCFPRSYDHIEQVILSTASFKKLFFKYEALQEIIAKQEQKIQQMNQIISAKEISCAPPTTAKYRQLIIDLDKEGQIHEQRFKIDNQSTNILQETAEFRPKRGRNSAWESEGDESKIMEEGEEGIKKSQIKQIVACNQRKTKGYKQREEFSQLPTSTDRIVNRIINSFNSNELTRINSKESVGRKLNTNSSYDSLGGIRSSQVEKEFLENRINSNDSIAQRISTTESNRYDYPLTTNHLSKPPRPKQEEPKYSSAPLATKQSTQQITHHASMTRIVKNSQANISRSKERTQAQIQPERDNYNSEFNDPRTNKLDGNEQCSIF